MDAQDKERFERLSQELHKLRGVERERDIMRVKLVRAERIIERQDDAILAGTFASRAWKELAMKYRAELARAKSVTERLDKQIERMTKLDCEINQRVNARSWKSLAKRYRSELAERADVRAFDWGRAGTPDKSVNWARCIDDGELQSCEVKC